MIDFNWTEILALMVIAVVVFGPEKLPDFARKAARVLAYLRRVSEDARGQLREELGPQFDDIRLSDLNPKNFVARHLLSAADKEDLLSIRDELRSVGTLASGGLADVKNEIEGVRDGAEPDDAPALNVQVTPYDPEAT